MTGLNQPMHTKTHSLIYHLNIVQWQNNRNDITFCQYHTPLSETCVCVFAVLISECRCAEKTTASKTHTHTHTCPLLMGHTNRSQYENIQPRQKHLAHIEQRINSNIWVIIPSDPVTSWHHCSSELIHILFFSGESGPKLSMTSSPAQGACANFCQTQSFLTHSPIGNNLEENKVDHTGYVWSNQCISSPQMIESRLVKHLIHDVIH